MKKHLVKILTAVGVLMVPLAVPVSASAIGGQKPSVVASFEDGWIQLADGWGEARACTSDGVSTRCYKSEADMDAAEVRLNGPLSVVPLADCALPTLKLYRSSSYAGSVLQLTARLVVINLASYGFDNDTSSYKIGSCSAGFYDTTGGATQYPGNTGANVTSPSMLSGWDNRVGSVYIT